MLIQTQIYKMLRTTNTFVAKMSVMRNTACFLFVMDVWTNRNLYVSL